MQKPHLRAKGARHLAREFALLGVYQWLTDPTRDEVYIQAHLMDLIQDDGQAVEDCDLTPEDFSRVDGALFDRLLSGVIRDADALKALVQPYLDRDFARVSMVEQAVLLLGAFELKASPETPWRVVINESVELAKQFGSGYRLANLVLEKVAHEVRATEIQNA